MNEVFTPEGPEIDLPVIRRRGRVEVRDRFEGRWTGEFEVEDVVLLDDGVPGYVLRRLSDGARLPAAFTRDEVRPT